MMERLGQAKTHLELKKIIAEVDTTNSGIDETIIDRNCSLILYTINRDFKVNITQNDV